MTEFWKHPKDEPPPRGTKLVLLTIGGVGTLGPWGDDCVLWSPMPKISKEMKLRLEAEQLLNRKPDTARPRLK